MSQNNVDSVQLDFVRTFLKLFDLISFQQYDSFYRAQLKVLYINIHLRNIMSYKSIHALKNERSFMNILDDGGADPGLQLRVARI